jgi:hypothetical protein
VPPGIAFHGPPEPSRNIRRGVLVLLHEGFDRLPSDYQAPLSTTAGSGYHFDQSHMVEICMNGWFEESPLCANCGRSKKGMITPKTGRTWRGLGLNSRPATYWRRRIRNQMVLGTANLAVEVPVGSQLSATVSDGDL